MKDKTSEYNVENPVLSEILGTAKSVTIKREFRSSKQFSRIALINTKVSRTTKEDIFEILVSLSKPAQHLFILIKQEMNYKTYIALIGLDDLTRSQKNIRLKAITELEKAGLARRLPRKIAMPVESDDDVTSVIKFRAGSYILSPDAIFPAEDYEATIRRLWNSSYATSTGDTTAPTKSYLTPNNKLFI